MVMDISKYWSSEKATKLCSERKKRQMNAGVGENRWHYVESFETLKVKHMVTAGMSNPRLVQSVLTLN